MNQLPDSYYRSSMKNALQLLAVSASITFLVACEREQPSPPKTITQPTPSQSSTPIAPQGGMANMPQFAANPVGVTSANGQITIAGISLSVPAGWKEVPPANQMRLAELSVPDPSGDASKACTVAFTSAGGDVQSNIIRWAGQMRDASGAAPKPEAVKKNIGGVDVTTVELIGAFQGMGETPKADWMLRGAILESPNGLVFIKMTGPQSAMKPAAAGWSTMIDSIKKK